MQHLQPDIGIVPENGVLGTGTGDKSGATCARFHVLGTVRGDAVLPVGLGALVTRNLWETGGLRRQAEALGSSASAV